MKKSVIIIVLLLLPAITYAGCGGGVCTDVNITEMQIDVGATIYVQTSGVEASLNCTPQAGVYLKLNGSTDGGRNIYSALLASQTTGKKLKIRILDNVSPCEITYVSTY